MRNLFLAVMVTLASASASAADWYEQYEKGVRLIEQGNAAEARAALEAALEARKAEGLQLPTRPQQYIDYLPHLYLAIANQMTGDVDTARKQLALAETSGMAAKSEVGRPLLVAYQLLLRGDATGNQMTGDVDTATSSAQEGASCDSAINVTPEKCSQVWLKESSTAGAAHYGNFWPPECGPPGPPPEYIITTDNICGCIDGPLDYYSEVTKFGCSAGPNPVAKIFETYPWCYVQNGIACPAAVSAGPGLPGIRQCGGTIQQTGQANAFGDKCSGDQCGYPPFAEFLKTWAKPEVYSAFEATGILKTIMEAGPIGGCDGGSCKNFTLVLPVTAAKDNPDALPRGTDLNQLVKNATGHGVAYIGEMFDGRNWKTLGGTTTRASVPSCPNVGAVSVYQAGHLPAGSGGATNVPPTPCLSVAPCISQTIYGEGILFDGARVQYWFITNEAILYFTDSPRHGG